LATSECVDARGFCALALCKQQNSG
jgi:hypothetical protein